MVELNPAQQKAAQAPDGPALVLAGAGSGKTRVIVERLAWLIDERGVDARRLLCLTFTNRAAREMRTRVMQRLGTERLSAWLGTFHGFGLYLLRRDIDVLGRRNPFTIFDDADQLAVMRRLIKDLPASATTVTPRTALSWISAFKQDIEAPNNDDIASEEDATCMILWTRYHDALRAASAVDFDDLLVLTAKALQQHEGVREKWQQRYQYIHIDEYQDTNRAQYIIARLLSGGHGNLFVVGDEDQSIYSWRGATIRNILDFERDFPSARVYRLEQNYRSTRPILSVANAVVQHNTERLGKNLWTEQADGAPVRCYFAEDGNDEAHFIVEDILKRKLNPDQVAILYRTNAQSRPFEEVLRARNMRYRVIGGIQFYQRKEVKDLLAYLSVAANPNDDESLRRIVNTPPRGIGKTTLDLVEAIAKEREIGLLQALRDASQDHALPARGRGALEKFLNLTDEIAMEAAGGTAPVGPLLEGILSKIEYRALVRDSDDKESRARLDIVEEFLSSCHNYDATSGDGLVPFLQERALVSDTDAIDVEQPVLTLLTCHSAKGLEFDHCFLAGLEEGLLPHFISTEDDDVEEERRLCYVAMTRARQSLTLTAAQRRQVYGEWQDRRPSRFLREIPDDLLQMESLVIGGGAAVTAEVSVTAPPPGRRSIPAAARTATPEVAAASLPALKLGTRVRHAQFGRGTVLATSGSGKKLRAKIRFETGRTRDFVVSIAPIEVVEQGEHRESGRSTQADRRD